MPPILMLCGAYDPARPFCVKDGGSLAGKVFASPLSKRSFCSLSVAFFVSVTLAFGCRFIGLGHASLPRRPRLECPLPISQNFCPQERFLGAPWQLPVSSAHSKRRCAAAFYLSIIAKSRRSRRMKPTSSSIGARRRRSRAQRENYAGHSGSCRRLSGWSPSASAFKYFLPEGRPLQ